MSNFAVLQGVVIFVVFDLKSKIYFMMYEKIMGKPHPSIRKHRLARLEKIWRSASFKKGGEQVQVSNASSSIGKKS